jgi:hypothetical protein
LKDPLMPTERAAPDDEQPQAPAPLHPVDRMAELKALIAALDLEYARLRGHVLIGKVSIGALWKTTIWRRTIIAAVRKAKTTIQGLDHENASRVSWADGYRLVDVLLTEIPL